MGAKIPRMPPGSKFTPPVMENPVLTSPAEVVVSDCTILCSLPRAAGANTLLRTSLSLETQIVHLAIRAVSTASWQEREQLLSLGREPLAEPRLQGWRNRWDSDSNLLLPQHLLICILYPGK